MQTVRPPQHVYGVLRETGTHVPTGLTAFHRTSHGTAKTVAIVLGGTAAAGFVVVILLFTKSAFKKKSSKHQHHYGG
ncbi:Cysteine-rich repeat secretory protein 11 [Bienertia sinuspersici]